VSGIVKRGQISPYLVEGLFVRHGAARVSPEPIPVDLAVPLET
jgi:hypothetical protein